MSGDMHYFRAGRGKPMLLVHGLGGTSRSWSPILSALARERGVVAVDLPGHGDSPRLPTLMSMSALADELTAFVRAHDRVGVDAVGSSMGARLVMELARRGGVLGTVVALDPGGFWHGWERHAFFASLWTSVRLLRYLQPVLPFIARMRLARRVLVAPLSARPAELPATLVMDELRSYAETPVFDELLFELAYGERQEGAPAGSLEKPLVIGWGDRDRVCLPRQAHRARVLFPDAHLYWFERCGHFPLWDSPQETTQLILDVTSGWLPARAREARPVRAPATGIPVPGTSL
jgi:pimeloyl-ACP methyl ester carboxylesterase